MKIFTSYFSQLKKFKPYMVPISSAMFDPKWYHNYKDRNHIFINEQSIILGARAEELVLKLDTWNKLQESGQDCKDHCPHTEDCAFMQLYYEQLKQIDFDKFYNDLQIIAEGAKQKLNLTIEPYIVIMVYEKSDVPCAERPVIQKWFKDHNIEVNELEFDY